MDVTLQYGCLHCGRNKRRFYTVVKADANGMINTDMNKVLPPKYRVCKLCNKPLRLISVDGIVP